MKTMIRLGQVVITPNALAEIPQVEIYEALCRHEFCDFGDISEADKETNLEALKSGGQIHSVYNSVDGIRFWIITEHDRSVTTILLPEDY